MKIYSIIKTLNSRWEALRFYHLCLFYVDEVGDPELVYDDIYSNHEMIDLIVHVFEQSGWQDSRLYISNLNVSSVESLGIHEDGITYDQAVEKVCR